MKSLFRISRIGFSALALFGPGALLAQSFPVLAGDQYQLQIHSRVEPVVINRIHAWELALTTIKGEPVSGAAIRISGGMPQHNHGLPTAPRVTQELAPGRYLLEGMKFQMGGAWELLFDIEAAAGKEQLRLDFSL